MGSPLHPIIPNDQVHPPRDFPGASVGDMLVKNEQAGVLWEARYTMPAALNFVTGANAPPTEVHGDIYVLLDSSVSHANWDGALQNDFVRYDSSADTWFSISPVEGVQIYDKTAQTYKAFGDDSDWHIGGQSAPQVLETSLLIVTADVLTLNGTPIEIVAAPGAGFAIEVVSWSTRAIDQAAMTAYAANTGLILITDTAQDDQMVDNRTLISTATRILRGAIGAASGATNTQLVENKALMASVDSGDPTTGDFDIKLYVQYRIIRL